MEPTSTPWYSSSCSKAGYLVKGMLSFAITKHSSNFRPICARVSRSIVDKLCRIAEDSTVDPPLTLTLSAQSCSMVALWTSLVAWFSTLFTFWFTEVVIETFENSSATLDFFHTSYIQNSGDATWRLSRSSTQRSHYNVWCSRSYSCCHFSNNIAFATWRLPDFFEGPISRSPALQEYFRPAILSDQRDTWTDNVRKCPNFCPMTDCYNLVCTHTRTHTHTPERLCSDHGGVNEIQPEGIGTKLVYNVHRIRVVLQTFTHLLPITGVRRGGREGGTRERVN